MSEYAERDAEELEPHYSKHVHAMTGESLHGKSAIAAELAFRDFIISELYEALLLAMSSIGPNDLEKFQVCNAALAKARGES